VVDVGSCEGVFQCRWGWEERESDDAGATREGKARWSVRIDKATSTENLSLVFISGALRHTRSFALSYTVRSYGNIVLLLILCCVIQSGEGDWLKIELAISAFEISNLWHLDQSDALHVAIAEESVSAVAVS
jgi:hypothetical protein